MTLDEYKQACVYVLGELPLNQCEGRDVFKEDEWSPDDRLTLCRLYTLYLMASGVPYIERGPFFDHWWKLPVEEVEKQTVFENM